MASKCHLYVTLSIHTAAHAEWSSPTLKDVERFRNGVFCSTHDFQLYVEPKLLIVESKLLFLLNMNPLNNLNTISIHSHQLGTLSGNIQITEFKSPESVNEKVNNSIVSREVKG